MTKKRKGKMGHNDGTQSPVDPMPKHPYILKRDGRYFYRRRIPIDLVRAGCYGKSRDIRRALGTSELATANRLAITVALQLDEEFQAKRRELGKPKNASSCKPSKKRRFLDISEIERKDFVMRYFISKEIRAAELRQESDPDLRKEYLWNVRDDLAAMSGELTNPQCDWLNTLRKALEEEGISTDGADAELLRDMAFKMQRAAVEAAARSESALRGIPFESFDPLFKEVHADSPLPALVQASKTIGDLCVDYMSYKEKRVENGKLARSTIPKIEMRCRIMRDFFGNDKPLVTINRMDAVQLVDFLQMIPSNAAKRYKGVSLVVAAEREAKLKQKRLLHPETADDYLSGLSAMLNYAAEINWIESNPLKGRLIRERMPKLVRRDRQTLTSDEMTRIFTSSDFIKEKKGKLAARFWLPLLCLFHGMRANEVAGLRASDVAEDEDVPFIRIAEYDERRLKNESSERRVPIHQRIIDMGFIEFAVRRKREAPNDLLFEGLKRNANGSMADGVSKWWGRFVKKTLGHNDTDGATGARGIHSLRHSWRNAARAAGIQESVAKYLGGWAQTDESGKYGWSGALPMLKEQIDSIDYPNVKFPRPIRLKRK